MEHLLEHDMVSGQLVEIQATKGCRVLGVILPRVHGTRDLLIKREREERRIEVETGSGEFENGISRMSETNN